MSKLGVLFVTTVPFDTPSGGAVYSKSIYDSLTDESSLDVELFVCKVHRHFRSRFFNLVLSAFLSVFSRLPINVCFFSDKRLIKTNTIRFKKYDLVVFDHLETMGLYEHISFSKSLYISHNIEHRLVTSRYSGLVKKIMMLNAGNLKRFEVKVARSVDSVVSVSADDLEWFKAYCNRAVFVPPLFSYSPIAPNCSSQNLRLGFLGSVGWQPNRVAFDVLLNDIYPQLRRSMDVELRVCGSGWGGIYGVPFKSVVYLGFLEDIRLFWNSIDVLVAPIDQGEGLNIKVAEAFHNNCLVIGYAHTFRGFPESVLEKHQHIIVNNAEECVKAITNLDVDSIRSRRAYSIRDQLKKSTLLSFVREIL